MQMTSVMRESRRLRFRLRTLLIMVAVFGIVAAWMADHARLTERLRQSQVENRVNQAQREVLQQELSVRYGAMQVHYWWADADEFVKMLTTASDDEQFLEMAPSLASAEDGVLRTSVEKLTALLNAPEERTRLRSLTALRFMQIQTPDRMAKLAPSIMPVLVPMLDDSSTRIVGEAIATAESFGPAARDAVVPLSKRMSDDSDWYAPDAARAIAKIDPTIEVGRRLTELVQTKHPNWYQAAFHLPRHVDTETARKVLTKAYDDAQDESERNMAVQALNQIATKTEPSDATESR